MIRPQALQPGNTVCIVAPGRKIDHASVQVATQILGSWGLTVAQGKNLFSKNHPYLSGFDDERLHDLQTALDDPNIHAIICARGGYGTTRILDQVDFAALQKTPKWICGFSDITALHLKLNALGIQSMHATMPVLFGKVESKPSVESLKALLFGESGSITAPASPHNKPGAAQGELIGGNLSLLVESLGTASELQTNGKILVLEEIDEYVYRIDRMLVQLKRAGKLTHLAALVIGHITDIKENDPAFAETVEELVRYHAKEFNYPVAFNLPTGHENPNLAWIEGATATLHVTAQQATLTF